MTTYNNLLHAQRQQGESVGFAAGVGAAVEAIERLAASKFIDGDDREANSFRSLASCLKTIENPYLYPGAAILDAAWTELRPLPDGVGWDDTIVDDEVEES